MAKKEPPQEYIAVSYTHLDVYKRQGRKNSADRTSNAVKRKDVDRSRERRKNAVSRRASRELSLIHI